MSLFGALNSGVSGLSAQSSAMSAISDNITNVSTVGYKNTQVDFQTLVTTQTSGSFYSAGGVQSRPRQDTGVQGLLAASTSQTDISISGAGFFVVNEGPTPTISDEFLFTRAGSFFQDNEGFLRNTSGFYLQAWPVDAGATVRPNNKALTIPNQNVISTDFLGTVNLNKVGGTAAATSTIGIGANLPSNDSVGTTHKTDVQFFDTLGNANSISVIYTKDAKDNQWDATTSPPPGAAVLTMEDTSGNAYKSIGQLEFTTKPNEGSTVVIDGTTYEFSSDATVQGTNTRVVTTTTSTAAVDVKALVDAVIATDSDFTTTNNRIKVNPGDALAVHFQDDGTKAIVINPTGLLTTTGDPASKQQTAFTVRQTSANYRDYEQFKFGSIPQDGDTVVINGKTYEFDDSGVDDTQTATAASVTVGTTNTQAVTLAANATAGVTAVQEISTITLTGTYALSDTITININSLGNITHTVVANDLTVNGDGTGGTASAAQARQNIAVKLANLANNTASAASGINFNTAALITAGTPSTGAFTVTADTAGGSFTVSESAATAGNGDVGTVETRAGVAGVKEVDTITLSGAYDIGDIISVQIDALTADTYTVVANDLTINGDGTGGDVAADSATARSNIATKLAAVVTAGNGVAVISAAASGAVVTITADNTGINSFATTTSTTNVGTQVAQVTSVTLSGSYEVGDTVTINVGVADTDDDLYTITANDLTANGDGTGGVATSAQELNNIAASVVIALNAGTSAATITATSGAGTGVINLTADTAGTPFVVETAEAINLSGGGITAGNFLVSTGGATKTITKTVNSLQTVIEASDPEFAAGATTVDIREDSNSGETDTLMLSTLPNSYDVTFNLTTVGNIPTHPDGTSPYTSGTSFSIDKSNAIIFNASGLPSEFNIAEIEIINFANGSANMDDGVTVNADGTSVTTPQITLDLGDVGDANGLTQFGGEFTPAFITQNGSQFGTFAGVTISTDGLITALFDNGETRPVFQIPLATFTNVNSLGSRTGNTWNATEASGDPTLRTAGNGPSGIISQSSLEQSTVDIGTEFTKMIVVQRAFSAAAKIISTADEMLEELLRVKR